MNVALLLLLSLFAVGCASKAPPSPNTAAVGLANLTKETLDALRVAHEGGIKAEARAAAAECADAACKKEAVDGTIEAAQPVTDKINAGVDLQNVVVALVRAELVCEEKGEADCSRRKLAELMGKLPQIQNIVLEIKKEIQTWRKTKSKSSPPPPSGAPAAQSPNRS